MNDQSKIKDNIKQGLQATIAAPDLLRAIRFAARPIEPRNMIPILGCIRMRFGLGRLTVTGTNLDIECEMSVDADCDTPFNVCVGPKAMAAMAGISGKALVTIIHRDDVMEVSADGVTVRFRELWPAEDFPVMSPEIFAGPDGKSASASIGEARLHKLLGDVAACISTEETRYYLNGVYMHAKDDGLLRAVTTDGHRLALKITDVPWVGLDGIVRAEAVRIIMSALAPASDREIRFIGTPLKQIVTPSDGEWSIRMKLIDGTFPDYTRVVPQKSSNITVPISMEMLKRTVVASRGRDCAIAFDPGSSEMSAVDVDNGIHVSVPLPGATGEKFGMNRRYLMEFLRRHGAVRLEGAGPRDPFHVITEDPDLMLVIMPMAV